MQAETTTDRIKVTKDFVRMDELRKKEVIIQDSLNGTELGEVLAGVFGKDHSVLKNSYISYGYKRRGSYSSYSRTPLFLQIECWYDQYGNRNNTIRRLTIKDGYIDLKRAEKVFSELAAGVAEGKAREEIGRSENIKRQEYHRELRDRIFPGVENLRDTDSYGQMYLPNGYGSGELTLADKEGLTNSLRISGLSEEEVIAILGLLRKMRNK